MTPRHARASRLVVLAMLVALPCRGAERVEVQLLIPEAPRPAPESLEVASAILARLSGASPGGVRITAAGDVDEARRSLEARPALALVSTPLYLEALARGDRPRLLRSPARAGRPTEVFHVVVRSGTAKDLAGLAGKTLAGNRLWDMRFVRVLLGPDAPAPVLRPVRQTLQAIKALRERSVDAALLSDLEIAALDGLVPKGELSTVHVSAPVPLAPLVSYLPAKGPREDGLVSALGKLCQDPEGSLLCEAFGIETFVAADPPAYEAVAAAYAASP